MAQAHPTSSDPIINPAVERPLSGLFAINKPSGVTSMALLDSLKSLFASSTLFVEDPQGSQVIQNTKHDKRNRNHWRQKKMQNRLVKMGQGGTLDPLASGVLVIGLNSATKKLSRFLNCTKTYRTTGLLGCETDSYDSVGKVIRLVDWKSVKPQDIQRQSQSIKGEHWQIPPIYSALKMDGKPLYEYARKNIPLPRPIEARRCEVFEIGMIDWQEGGSSDAGAHAYRWPTEEISDEDRQMMEVTNKLIQEKGIVKLHSQSDPILTPKVLSSGPTKREHSSEALQDQPDSKKIKIADLDNASPDSIPAPSLTKEQSNTHSISMSDNGLSPAFTLEMTVSSGTYVRTIVHDIGKAVGSAATVVSLIRTRQGGFALDPKSRNSSSKSEPDGHDMHGCIEWDIFEKAIQAQKQGLDLPRDETDGLQEWERELLKHIVP